MCSAVLNLAAGLGEYLSESQYVAVYKLKAIEAPVVSNKSQGYFNLLKINAQSQLKALLVWSKMLGKK